jgi:hypothetical protein
VRLCPIGGDVIREEPVISGALTIVATYCSEDYLPSYFIVGGLNGTTFFFVI